MGSINLSKIIDDNGNVDLELLNKVTEIATRFLNRMLDASVFPVPECKEAMDRTRKIGIGIMGLHDMLIKLEVAYDSKDGRDIASGIMEEISDCAYKESERLGKLGHVDRHNTNLTTIAPTGTLSMLANCSSGCEPYFSFDTVYKSVMDGERFAMFNPIVEWLMQGEDGDKLTEQEVRDWGVVVLKGASEISPTDHVLMQASLQRHVDSSISKTINMPSTATVEEVEAVYMLAWEMGCKGVTVYRDGCKAGQVLTTASKEPAIETVDCMPELIKLDLPDELGAKRYRIKDADGNKGYLIVCFDDDKNPLEIFHKQPFRDNDVLWATVCRSVSLSLRFGIPLNEVVKQLGKASGSVSDLPAQLSRILSGYLTEPEILKESCPECKGQMIFESGCSRCIECGASKCS